MRGDFYTPDGAEPAGALARTTDLGVGAHPDDLEFFMLVPIAECRNSADRHFTGVTCTNGARGVRRGSFAHFTDEQMADQRRAEQRNAAEAGGYGAMVQLGFSSEELSEQTGRGDLVDELVGLITSAGPSNLYTHNLADKHATHVAVGAAVVRAIRRIDPDQRPQRLFGFEAWRDLDWLSDQEKVLFDASGMDDLANSLSSCFESQIAGAKPYHRATLGRRRANAVFGDHHAVEAAEQISVAFDLTPLIRDDELDPARFVSAAIDRFRHSVEAAIRNALD